ncbi:MAG: hypothetical protein HRU20_19655 [Pseudomonadales bacterium]|nr:hypothetical protein [Pseudomonadales bacterium]
MTGLLIPFAKQLTTGNFVFVDEVDSGLACGCVCIGCDEDLQANKGKVKTHHFSHKPKSVDDDRICPFTFERCMFWMCREIMENITYIMLPEYSIDFVSRQDMAREQKLIFDPDCIHYPIGLENTYREDIAVISKKSATGKVYKIAFKFHYKNEKQISHIWEPKRSYEFEGEEIALISVSLNGLGDRLNKTGKNFRDGLQDILADDLEIKSWLYHPKEAPLRIKHEQALEEINSELRKAEELKIKHRQAMVHTSKPKINNDTGDNEIKPMERSVTPEDEENRLEELVAQVKSLRVQGVSEAYLCKYCFFMSAIGSSKCDTCGHSELERTMLNDEYFIKIEKKYKSKCRALLSAKRHYKIVN